MLCLYSLAVVPSKRKRGIGFSVLAQAEKVAEQFKLQGLEVEVLKSNVSAQRLYLKFGFKMVAEGQMTKVFRKQV
jgi:ribosomal-protein-alanine N-acetyltransferase